MKKIANTTELQAEIRQILAYAQSEQPSREHVAKHLQLLSARVAGFGKTKDEWVSWLDKSISQPGQNLLEFANHFVGTMGDTFPPNVKRQAMKVYRAAQQLDHEVGQLFIEMGR
jgi:hypothetical protein